MSYRKTGLLHPSSPFGHHSLSSVHKPCILSRFSAPINILNLCSLAFAKGHLCYQNSILSIVSASSIVLVHLLLKTFDLFFILKFFPLLTLKLVSACVPYPLFSLCLSLSLILFITDLHSVSVMIHFVTLMRPQYTDIWSDSIRDVSVNVFLDETKI